jgi:hypothetical protein
VLAHKAASVCQFLTQKNVTTLYRLPYSPDLSPPDYYLLPKLKMKLKVLHFADVAEIQEAVTDELKKVQKEELSAALQKLYDLANICIQANGVYFEFKKWYVSMIFKKISPKPFGPHCVFVHFTKFTESMSHIIRLRFIFNIIFSYILFHPRERFLLGYEPRVM